MTWGGRRNAISNLGTAGSILGSTTSNELGGVLGHDVRIDRQVLLLSEDGVVLLELILIEKGLIARGL